MHICIDPHTIVCMERTNFSIISLFPDKWTHVSLLEKKKKKFKITFSLLCDGILSYWKKMLYLILEYSSISGTIPQNYTHTECTKSTWKLIQVHCCKNCYFSCTLKFNLSLCQFHFTRMAFISVTWKWLLQWLQCV